MSAAPSKNPNRFRLALAITASALCVWSFAHAWILGGLPGLALTLFCSWCLGVTWLQFAGKACRQVEWVSEGSDGSPKTVKTVEEPILGNKGQWIAFAILLAFTALLLSSFPNTEAREAPFWEPSRLAIGWLVAAVLAFVVQKLIRALTSVETHPGIATSLNLITLAIPVSSITAAALFLSPYDNGRTSIFATYFIAALTVVLVCDSVFKQVSRNLAPASQRDPSAVPGTGFVLEMVDGEGWKRFLSRFEELTGTRLENVAGLRFVSGRLLPAFTLGISLLWLSTALTIVPLGSTGIRQHLGVFSTSELGPGLHLSLPRPLGNILVVNTGKVREVAVGFENDLLGPVLWNERHFEGEENFLVGEGDEVLTVNMPVLYRIAEPRNFLLNARDTDKALRSLAEKELLRVISGRSLFDLIGPQREAIAEEVRVSLRGRVAELGLGLEILFVGLKDMHPPVQVSDAYQMVASAEEQRLIFIENARATAVSRLGLARESSHRFQVMADRDANLTTLFAEGEATSFRALAEADRADDGLFRDRLYYEALASTLSGQEKIILPPGGKTSIMIDHRNGSTQTP